MGDRRSPGVIDRFEGWKVHRDVLGLVMSARICERGGDEAGRRTLDLREARARGKACKVCRNG